MARKSAPVETLVVRNVSIPRDLDHEMQRLAFSDGFGGGGFGNGIGTGKFGIHALELAFTELDRDAGTRLPPVDSSGDEPSIRNFHLPKAMDARMGALAAEWGLSHSQALLRMLALGTRESRRIDGPSLVERMTARIAARAAEKAAQAVVMERIALLAAERGMETTGFMEFLLEIAVRERPVLAPRRRRVARKTAA